MRLLTRQPDSNGSLTRLVDAYLTAKEVVIDLGFSAEIDWQHDLSLSDLTESYFLCESAWVILSAGMRESIVRRKFPAITRAFRNWESARTIVSCRHQCKRDAMAVFSNERKITAILMVAEEVNKKGFPHVKKLVFEEGIDYIRDFPFMGPVTSFHLAKNLGVPVVKPDRHLVRVAKRVGYPSPDSMCQAIAQIVGDKIAVIDLVIWRYATLNRNYLTHFSI